MELMKLLQDQLTNRVITNLSQQIGATDEQTSLAAQGIFASLVGGLANNATSDKGLRSLSSALDRDHDGSILDDVMGMIGGINKGNITDANNGAGIVGHIFGANKDKLASNIGASTGLDGGQIMKIMVVLAPIVMAVVGKMKKSNITQQTASGGMGDWVNILMDTAQSAQANGFGDLLGNIIGGEQAPNQQEPTGSGGLLGNIFGSIFKK